MKKLIFILLCFCLLTFGSSARIIEVAPAGAWGVLGISGGGAVAEGGGDLADDFTGGITDWTEVEGTWSGASGYAVPTELGAGPDAILVYNTQTSTIDQWIEVKLTTVDSNGVTLRATNTGAATWDGFTVFADATYVYLYYYVDGDFENISGLTGSPTWYWEHTFNAGDYMGIEIIGTDAATTIYVWDNGTSSVPHASWGAADFNSGAFATGITSGTYIGLSSWELGGQLDDFKAGDK